MLGEVTPQAWALGDCEPRQEHRKTIEWEAKGITPILYQVPAGSHDHSALHKTLHSWAETYRDGVLGKERIVVSHALAQPSASTQQDDFVGRMLWALSDKSGLPAKRFADFNPVPSLDWLLEAFSDERFQHSDLARFDVPPRNELDTKLRFSLIRRPAPYDRAPPMLLASGGITGSQWDDVMFHLARWLTRHLDDPRLIIWIAQRGGQLHDRWPRLIEHELDRFASLERDGKTTELDEIRSQAPKAIPGPLMHTLWRLLLSGRVKSSWRDLDLCRWKGRLKREGLTTTLRLELRELLAPQVALKKPFYWSGEEESPGEHRQQFAAFLTYAALRPTEGYTVDEFRSAIGALPQAGLEECAQALSQALESAADQREDYWKNRVQPFWQHIWPKSRDLATPRIAESLTRLIIAARSELPAAFTAMQDWLQPIEHPYYVIHLLHESELCARFPEDALRLLNAVIDDQQFAPRELEQCLHAIVQAAPHLAQDAGYQQLIEYFRRRGM